MKFCNNGYSRFVVLIGPYAVKMPYVQYSWYNFVRGVYMNLNEVVIYNYVKKMRPQHLYLLCPIVRPILGGLFLVMQRAEIGLCEGDMYGHWKLIDDARLSGDDKTENYGRINGRIVKLDYAACKQIFD